MLENHNPDPHLIFKTLKIRFISNAAMKILQVQLQQDTQPKMAGVNYFCGKLISYRVREKTPVKATRARKVLVGLKGRKFSFERGVMFAKCAKTTLLAVPVRRRPRMDHLLILLSSEAERDRRIQTDGKPASEKKARAEGVAYRRKSGKLKSPRKAGRPCHCSKKCFEKVNEEERNHLLMQFNQIGNHNMQNQ